MNMYMRYRLSSILAILYSYIESRRLVQSLKRLLHALNSQEKICYLRRSEVGEPLTFSQGTNERMPGKKRTQIREDEGVRGSVENLMQLKSVRDKFLTC